MPILNKGVYYCRYSGALIHELISSRIFSNIILQNLYIIWDVEFPSYKCVNMRIIGGSCKVDAIDMIHSYLIQWQM